MSRLLCVCAAVAASSGTLAAGLASASTPAPPRAELVSPGCHQAANALNRSVSITAVMRPVPRTKRMQLRFQLWRRSGREPFMQVSGGDLDRWIGPSNPTLGRQPDDKWVLQKQVVNLVAPAAYRFKVSFRWIGSGGSALKTVTLKGPLCKQR